MRASRGKRRARRFVPHALERLEERFGLHAPPEEKAVPVKKLTHTRSLWKLPKAGIYFVRSSTSKRVITVLTPEMVKERWGLA